VIVLFAAHAVGADAPGLLTVRPTLASSALSASFAPTAQCAARLQMAIQRAVVPIGKTGSLIFFR
jgi:hypothetical protein